MKLRDLKQEELTNNWGKLNGLIGVVLYKSYSRRNAVKDNYEDDLGDDVEYHITEDEAINRADNMSLEVGFYPVVDKITIDMDNLSDIDFDVDDIELSDLDDYRTYYGDYEEVYSGCTNEGDNIKGAVLVAWNYEKYVGYARNLEYIGVAGEYPFHDFETESDLYSGNEERTFHTNYSVVATLEDLDGLTTNEKQNLIEERLNESHWKWNFFGNAKRKIEEFIESLDEEYVD